MKILMINQPLNNRGDESAHRALINTILKEIPKADITVLFNEKKNTKQEDSVRQFSVDSPRVKYVIVKPCISKGMAFIEKIGQKYNLHFIWRLHPGIRKFMSYFKKTDVVLCAPGGMCMGGFQRWGHVFELQCAKYYKKPLAYYGRSFGPFPMLTSDNKKFKELSLEMLNYFSFLSIRDKKTEAIANELNIKNYVSVVDSAFLETPQIELPQEIASLLSGSKYITFVPNLLIWHPAYKGLLSKKEVVDFYCNVLDCLFEKYPTHKIVMLPQTFDCDTVDGNDVNLFREIKKVKADERIFVVNDTYSSNIQQAIVAKANLVIGARYHSIVFAINNNTPVIALSYEHKIAGLLEALGKQDCLIDIQKEFKTPEGRAMILAKIKEMLNNVHDDMKAQKKAHDIAMDGFLKFKEFVYNLNK